MGGGESDVKCKKPAKLSILFETRNWRIQGKVAHSANCNTRLIFIVIAPLIQSYRFTFQQATLISRPACSSLKCTTMLLFSERHLRHGNIT